MLVLQHKLFIFPFLFLFPNATNMQILLARDILPAPGPVSQCFNFPVEVSCILITEWVVNKYFSGLMLVLVTFEGPLS